VAGLWEALDGLRMDDGDAWVARKVSGIERQNMRQAMNAHHRDQMRIMHLYAGNAGRDDQVPPLAVNRGDHGPLFASLVETGAVIGPWRQDGPVLMARSPGSRLPDPLIGC
jgi:hypothetical protein